MIKKALYISIIVIVMAFFWLGKNYNESEQVRQSVIDSYERYEDPHSSSEILIVPVSDTVEAHVSEGFDPITLLHHGAVDKFDKVKMQALRKEQAKNPLEGGAKIIQTLRFQPIDFYGRFIDQYGDPVIGAKLRIRVKQPGTSVPFAMASDYKTLGLRATTDANGEIHITGVQGAYFKIESFEIDGYIFSSSIVRQTLGSKTKVGLDTTVLNPYIFKGWKIDTVTEDVKGISFDTQSIKPIVSGIQYTVSLNPDKGSSQSFRQGNDGDITFYVERVWDLYQPNQGHSYRIVMDFKNGGVAEKNNDSPYTYRAPESGYRSRIEIEKIRNKENLREWKGGIYKKFYYYNFTIDGQEYYGNLDVMVDPFVPKDRISFEIYGQYNTNGERHFLTEDTIIDSKEALEYRYDN